MISVSIDAGTGEQHHNNRSAQHFHTNKRSLEQVLCFYRHQVNVKDGLTEASKSTTVWVKCVAQLDDQLNSCTNKSRWIMLSWRWPIVQLTLPWLWFTFFNIDKDFLWCDRAGQRWWMRPEMNNRRFFESLHHVLLLFTLFCFVEFARHLFIVDWMATANQKRIQLFCYNRLIGIH